MAEFSTSSNFTNKASKIMEEIAHYTHSNGFCGYTAASEFLVELMNTQEKVASAPLAHASDWGHPQRRAFFNYKGQYTIILIVRPPSAKKNEDIERVIYTNIYPSQSKEGNVPRSVGTKIFDAGDILDD